MIIWYIVVWCLCNWPLSGLVSAPRKRGLAAIEILNSSVVPAILVDCDKQRSKLLRRHFSLRWTVNDTCTLLFANVFILRPVTSVSFKIYLFLQKFKAPLFLFIQLPFPEQFLNVHITSFPCKTKKKILMSVNFNLFRIFEQINLQILRWDYKCLEVAFSGFTKDYWLKDELSCV